MTESGYGLPDNRYFERKLQVIEKNLINSGIFQLLMLKISKVIFSCGQSDQLFDSLVIWCIHFFFF